MLYLVISREEVLNDRESLVVDGLILVGLQSLDPVQPSTLLHHHGHLVHLPELLGGGEDVGEPVQDHTHGLVVLGGQEVTERLQNSLQQNT